MTTLSSDSHSASSKDPDPRAKDDRLSRDGIPHRTIDRVTEIMEHVAHSADGLTLAELVQITGGARTSIHGFVWGLVSAGWLFAEGNRFYLGPVTFSLTLGQERLQFDDFSLEDLQRVSDRAGTSALLALRVGTSIVYVGRTSPDGSTANWWQRRQHGWKSLRRPLFDTAAGRALVAAQPDSTIRLLIANTSADQADAADEFLRQIDDIRDKGYSLNEHPDKDLSGLAVAVRDRHGEHPVAAIALVGPVAVVRERRDELVAILKDAANCRQR
ncbi:IclR family transcriptional regulator C-terminal domain-containing protein [Rhodococcus sp. T2V]|uniref:IclR family transcriptional regulator n=1 Tax=Rhodococcus sp. T2V TaxID=3034164 RepID=UPI0023E22F36|nr:IclR family transcriptional regulator C-terminal domain-containing protein [Rhodococcus sp. T2V]MDF3304476.1 IclR family transcriptional regulator C-terminal domain-containing protein [Rhodococcus sp. T2V]